MCNNVELLTRYECEQILERIYENSTGRPKLRDFVVDGNVGGLGFLGEYFLLTLSSYTPQHGDGAEVVKYERLFVKALPRANKQLREYIVNRGILKKEATVYSVLLRRLGRLSKRAWCPQCYYARDDLLVLEKLDDLDYLQSPSAIGYFQDAEIRDLLRGLAEIHACSIAHEIEDDIVIGETYKDALFEITVSANEDYFATGLDAVLYVIGQLSKYQNEEQQRFIAHDLRGTLETVYDMINTSNKYRNVFCHRDSWANNLFFRKNKANANSDLRHVMFVDFQTCRYCPPAIDVVYSLYMNLDTVTRKTNEQNHLLWYYECLHQAFCDFHIKEKDQITQEEFRQSYQDFQLFGVLYKAIAATILHVPNDFLSNLKDNHAEAYYHYVYVDRTRDVLRLMEENIEFKEYMYECLEDLLNVVGRTEQLMKS